MTCDIKNYMIIINHIGLDHMFISEWTIPLSLSALKVTILHDWDFIHSFSSCHWLSQTLNRPIKSITVFHSRTVPVSDSETRREVCRWSNWIKPNASLDLQVFRSNPSPGSRTKLTNAAVLSLIIISYCGCFDINKSHLNVQKWTKERFKRSSVSLAKTNHVIIMKAGRTLKFSSE